MSVNIDVVVMINDYCHLMGGGAGHSSKSSMIAMQVVLTMAAMAPQFAKS